MKEMIQSVAVVSQSSRAGLEKVAKEIGFFFVRLDKRLSLHMTQNARIIT